MSITRRFAHISGSHHVRGFCTAPPFGSLRQTCPGTNVPADLLANWQRSWKLPLVYIGLAKDFWRGFADDICSSNKASITFFVSPSELSGKNLQWPGRRPFGELAMALKTSQTFRKLVSAGHEVGLHGIDAGDRQLEGARGLQEIRRLTGVSETVSACTGFTLI